MPVCTETNTFVSSTAPGTSKETVVETDTAHSPAERTARGAYVWFGAAIVLTSLGYGTTFLLPLRLGALGGGPQDVGEVLAVGAIATVLVCPFVGHISDRLGQSGAAVLAAGLLAASMFGFATADSLGWFPYACGAFLGAGWALVYTLCPIMTAATSSPGDRVRLLAIVQGLQMIGMGGGPVLGRAVTVVYPSLAVAFYVVAVGCFVSVFIFSYLQWTGFTKKSNSVARMNITHVRTILKSKVIIPIIMIFIGGAIFGSLSNFQTKIASYLNVDYVIFFTVFVAVVVGSRFALASKLKRYPPYRILSVLLTVMTLALAMLTFAHQTQLLYVAGAGLFAFGYGLCYPVLSAIVANTTPSDQVAQGLQLFTLSYFLAIFGFPYVSGAVIAMLGIPALLYLLVALGALEMALAMSRSRREGAVSP